MFLDAWDMDDVSETPFTICSAKTDNIPSENYISYGSVDAVDNTLKIEKEWAYEGEIYKNELAYIFFADFPSYAGDLYEPEEYDTRKTFMMCIENKVREEEFSLRLFSSVMWQSPLTVYRDICMDTEDSIS